MENHRIKMTPFSTHTFSPSHIQLSSSALSLQDWDLHSKRLYPRSAEEQSDRQSGIRKKCYHLTEHWPQTYLYQHVKTSFAKMNFDL